jgi:hypothetical protein
MSYSQAQNCIHTDRQYTDTAVPGATHKNTENFTFPAVIKITILLNKKRETTKLSNKKRERNGETKKLSNKKPEITKLANKKREITKPSNKKREITKLFNKKRGKLRSVLWPVPSLLLPR